MHPPSGNDIADKALLKLAPVPLVAYRNRVTPLETARVCERAFFHQLRKFNLESGKAARARVAGAVAALDSLEPIGDVENGPSIEEHFTSLGRHRAARARALVPYQLDAVALETKFQDAAIIMLILEVVAEPIEHGVIEEGRQCGFFRLEAGLERRRTRFESSTFRQLQRRQQPRRPRSAHKRTCFSSPCSRARPVSRNGG